MLRNWIYRYEFSCPPATGRIFVLHTNVFLFTPPLTRSIISTDLHIWREEGEEGDEGEEAEEGEEEGP